MIIRWVDVDYEIREDLIGMVHVPDITSPTLIEAIEDVYINLLHTTT